jgi:hypothetical protein
MGAGNVTLRVWMSLSRLGCPWVRTSLRGLGCPWVRTSLRGLGCPWVRTSLRGLGCLWVRTSPGLSVSLRVPRHAKSARASSFTSGAGQSRADPATRRSERSELRSRFSRPLSCAFTSAFACAVADGAVLVRAQRRTRMGLSVSGGKGGGTRFLRAGGHGERRTVPSWSGPSGSAVTRGRRRRTHEKRALARDVRVRLASNKLNSGDFLRLDERTRHPLDVHGVAAG